MKKAVKYLVCLAFLSSSAGSLAQTNSQPGKATAPPVMKSAQTPEQGPERGKAKKMIRAAASSASKDYQPQLIVFPDAGQAFDMRWSYSDKGQPSVVYGSPNSDNILWQFSCGRKPNIISQNQKVAPFFPVTGILNATTTDLRPYDQFGFTVRVDNGASQGLLGQLGSTQIGNGDFYMPNLVLDANNPLFEKLANGKRAFLKIDGNRFSIDLTGSRDPIRQFVSACKAKITSAVQANPQ